MSNYWINFWNNNHIVEGKSVHEKIGRTIAGEPISEEKWDQCLLFLRRQLELQRHDILLDIGAGSGAICIPFSRQVEKVVAVDVSEKLLASIQKRKNLQKIASDILTLNFPAAAFTKVIFYFAIQHFDEGEVVNLLKKIFSWLSDGGILYIGDVPLLDKKFDYFKIDDYEKAYFESIAAGKPIIGNWYNEDFFLKLGKYIGFSETLIVYQPTDFINAHYRFDVKFIK